MICNKNKLSGWLLLDKPRGITSNYALTKVKKIIGKNQKIGHAGTLDPLAEGVLPIALGEATKTTSYLMNAEKEYIFDITWGEERSTYDLEGEVTKKGGEIPDSSLLEKVLKSFIGEILQVPPAYSAIKIKGKPAYKLAREGKDIEFVARKILIKELELISHDINNMNSRLRVRCGKGTYVRSLAVDIARKAGGLGFVSYLKRTKVGNFLIENAKVLDNYDEIVHSILPTTFSLGDILAIEVSNEQALKIKNGLKVDLISFTNQNHNLVQIICNKGLVAIAQIDKGRCIPIRVFNL